VGHEAHDGEDDEAGEHAGARVDAAHDDGVSGERGGHERRPFVKKVSVMPAHVSACMYRVLFSLLLSILYVLRCW